MEWGPILVSINGRLPRAMDAPATNQRLGPIWLAPGITRVNLLTKFWAAFVSIVMLSGASILQGYLLTEHLNIPRSQQGTVSGEISFWVEIVAILLFIPCGVLADRIGRRPVYISSLVFVAVGYALAPFATTANELLAFRLIFAIGMAGVAGTMATLTADYPREDSRGIMAGITSICSTLGSIFVAVVIARIPLLLGKQGFDPVTGGKAMYLFAAALALITVIIAQAGLAAGTPAPANARPGALKLFLSGMRNSRNPRIALAYAGSFAARSDLVIKGLFLSLWAIQDGFKRGMHPGESMARFGIMIGIMSTVAILAAPIFGWWIDRVNRVTAVIVALCFASAGYLSMGIISSPLDFNMVPFFIVISLGSGFMMKSSISLIGQEAPIRERGSVIATASMFGAVGILVFTKWGGILFDAWGPWAPFVLAGAYQSVLLVVAVAIRIAAPGQPAPKPFRPALVSDTNASPPMLRQ
jgi:MFS family permease